MIFRLFIQEDFVRYVDHLRRMFVDGSALIYRDLEIWQARAKQRRQLAKLDERALSDMGISFAERDEELRKPFWQK
jgi:uncharacterized protein YjiS (DUF1127 family)